jgi:transposase
VAIEAIRGEKTLSQLGSQFKVYLMQIAKWRTSVLEHLPKLFVDGRTRKGRNRETDRGALYEEIGRLKVELHSLLRPFSIPNPKMTDTDDDDQRNAKTVTSLRKQLH